MPQHTQHACPKLRIIAARRIEHAVAMSKRHRAVRRGTRTPVIQAPALGESIAGPNRSDEKPAPQPKRTFGCVHVPEPLLTQCVPACCSPDRLPIAPAAKRIHRRIRLPSRLIFRSAAQVASGVSAANFQRLHVPIT